MLVNQHPSVWWASGHDDTIFKRHRPTHVYCIASIPKFAAVEFFRMASGWQNDRETNTKLILDTSWHLHWHRPMPPPRLATSTVIVSVAYVTSELSAKKRLCGVWVSTLYEKIRPNFWKGCNHSILQLYCTRSANDFLRHLSIVIFLTKMWTLNSAKWQ